MHSALVRRATRRLFARRSKLVWPALQEEGIRAIALASEHVGPVLHVTTVLSRAGWDDFSREEKGFIARIEHRRRITNSSNEVVQYRDYGAGTPEAARTTSEMAEGLVVNGVVSAPHEPQGPRTNSTVRGVALPKLWGNEKTDMTERTPESEAAAMENFLRVCREETDAHCGKDISPEEAHRTISRVLAAAAKLTAEQRRLYLESLRPH
jgi:hypothetical protein